MGTNGRTWLALTLAMATLAGCSGGDGPEQDSDNDGVFDALDCAPGDGTRWRFLAGHVDADLDGVGAGPALQSCVGHRLPAGLSAQGGDCAPDDASRWREQSGLYPDQDNDGATGEGPVTACVGDTLVGYRLEAGPPDCDDTDFRVAAVALAWPDPDGDGVGSGEPVSHCAGRQPPSGHAPVGGDCAPDESLRAHWLAYTHRDADRDGFTVPEEGRLCALDRLPEGYALHANGLDCDDANGARWMERTVYVDTDGDGFGSGAPQTQCTGQTVPLGYALDAEDCAPEDGTRWQWRSYAHRDADGDGDTIPQQGVMCSGAQLPQGYAEWPTGQDCDDRDARRMVSWSLFPDTDGDGVGAGARQTVCEGRTLPEGFSLVDTDCAPVDVTRWQELSYAHRDADGDGFTTPEAGALCAGAALPAGYATLPQGHDCDDADRSVHTNVLAWPDTDGDGVGEGDPVVRCTDGTRPTAPWSAQGGDCAAEDATRWREVAYTHVDRDADGHTQPEAGSVCAGTSLPEPYFTQATGNDCDDADAARYRWVVLYPDADGDGVGASPRTIPCIGARTPSGFSFQGDDADDSDASIQEDAEDALMVELILD
ncbi:hypothetical protein ACLEPN_08960 [Myxococcus sp. 1LA]